MIKRLATYISNFLKPASTYEYLSDEAYEAATSFFTMKVAHDIYKASNSIGIWKLFWFKVTCPEEFPGCGFVEGRDQGAVISSRLRIVEADDDMGFTELCVLLDKIPTAIIRVSGSGASIGIIGGDRYRFLTCQDRDKLPDPIRRMVEDILKAFSPDKFPKPGAAAKRISSY